MLNPKVSFFPFEEFREISLNVSVTMRYAISNYGRLLSFLERFEDGRILKGSLICGYHIIRYKPKDKDGKLLNRHLFQYKLVAEYFLPKPTPEQVYVIHLDYDRLNDHVSNLKWATKAEMVDHNNKSPFVIEAKRRLRDPNIKSGVKKLTVTNVMLIKKIMSDPNRKTRVRLLAKQFGVSEMQLQRIKTGENWKTVKPLD